MIVLEMISLGRHKKETPTTLLHGEDRLDVISIHHIIETYSKEEARSWLRANNTEMRRNCATRCRKQLNTICSASDLSSVPAHILFNIAQAMGEEVFVPRNPAVFKPSFFYTIDYLVRNSQVSSHYLVFGETIPIELFGRTAGFIRTMNTLTEAKQTEIMSLLQEKKYNASNFFIWFKQRCLECVYADDQNLDTISNLRWFGSAVNDMAAYLFGNPIPQDLHGVIGTPLNSGADALQIVFYYCYIYAMSADFFLMQDYSPYAQLDGKPLSDTQKAWLSAYLMASMKGQHMAICKMAHWLVDR